MELYGSFRFGGVDFFEGIVNAAQYQQTLQNIIKLC